MTKIYDLNRIATYGGSTNCFYLKETLKNAGWVVSQSSDGATFFSGSDGITTDNSGSGGMNNNFAWYFIKDPAGLRGISVQRTSGTLATIDTDDQMWRVAHYEDVSVGIVSGSNTIAAFIDVPNTQSVTCGSGSDTNPLFEKMFETSGSFRCHTIAMNTPYNGVYAWYNFNSITGSLITGSLITGSFIADSYISGSYISSSFITGSVITSSLIDKVTSLWHHKPFLTSSIVNSSSLSCITKRGFPEPSCINSDYLGNLTMMITARNTSVINYIGGCSLIFDSYNKPDVLTRLYSQRIYDLTLNEYVYYELPVITNYPTAIQTTPSNSGDLNTNSHEVSGALN